MRSTAVHILFCGMMAALGLTLGSCLKEDNDHCPSTVALTFRYEHNPDYTDLFQGNVDRVRLYVYDNGGRHLATHEAAASSMQNKNTMKLQLDKGSYKIVVWGNPDDNEFEALVGQEQTFDNSTLHICTDGNGQVSGNTTNLFHGMTTLAAGEWTTVRDTVLLIRNTNDITVLVEGMENMFGTSYFMQIDGCNGSYNFDNSLCDGSSVVTYLPRYSTLIMNNILYSRASFKVMRLRTDSDLRLSITDSSGATAASDNLGALLLREFPQIQTNDDLDRYYDYTFVYRFNTDRTFTLVRIQVGDWEAVPGLSGEI